MSQYTCTDHIGNKYSSLTSMLNHYNVSKTVYYRCLRQNIPLKTILTQYDRKPKECFDHLGNKFDTVTAMLNHYGISDSIYSKGIRDNIPLEQILTWKKHTWTDHKGNIFNTRQEMCDYWHISLNVYRRRIKDGWNLEQALTEQPRRMFSFPHIIYNDCVKTHLKVLRHINNDYFECNIDNKTIIMSKSYIITYAEQLLEKESTHELE